MSEDRIAGAIPRRCRRNQAVERGQAGVIKRILRPVATPQDLEDEARWLDEQVRGWTAARTL